MKAKLSKLGLLALVALVALMVPCVSAAAAGGGVFQSDELTEDDEEWGLVGTPSASPATADDGWTRRAPASDVPASGDTSKVQFPLEHAFGNSDFSPAGFFTARLRPSSRGGQALVKLRLSRIPLSETQQAAFEVCSPTPSTFANFSYLDEAIQLNQELLREDGFYSIRVPANALNPGKTFVISSTKARCLAAANLKERFDIYMEQGNIVAVGYGAGAECPYPRVLKYPSKWTFDTHIVSKSGEQASRTVLLNDIEVGSDEKLGDEALSVKKLPEKSFWAKYWMYIIPLGLIVMNAITQVANMQDEQGGAPGQTARAANAGAGVRRR